MMRPASMSRGPAPGACPVAALAIFALFTVALPARPLAAQTDYYNLDHDRPLRVEDAYAVERYALELALVPLDLAGARAGGVWYSPAAELKYGLFTGAEASIGAGWRRATTAATTGAAAGELELSALYNLNTETLSLPALGIRLTGHLPLGGTHGPSAEVRGILTRTLGGPVRAHVNAAAVLGDDGAERWWWGAALDYVLPFRATLLLAETIIARPGGTGALRVDSGIGLRQQLTPTLGVDAGVGRSWTGAAGDDWRVTIGVTGVIGVRALVPKRPPSTRKAR